MDIYVLPHGSGSYIVATEERSKLMFTSKTLTVLLAIFDPVGSGLWYLHDWLSRRRVRRRIHRELAAAGSRSFTVDVCEPDNMLFGDGTAFGTMTFKDGTTIRGAL